MIIIPNTEWSDLNKDGRRLEKIILQMDTKIAKTKNDDLKLAYIDRLIKATHVKAGIAETVLNVRNILKAAQKNIPTSQEVINN